MNSYDYVPYEDETEFCAEDDQQEIDEISDNQFLTMKIRETLSSFFGLIEYSQLKQSEIDELISLLDYAHEEGFDLFKSRTWTGGKSVYDYIADMSESLLMFSDFDQSGRDMIEDFIERMRRRSQTMMEPSR